MYDYAIIQTSPLTLTEKSVAQNLERSRFDPRLMEVMTEHIRDFWWHLEPTLLNRACRKQRSPFVIKGVIAAIFEYCEISVATREEFSAWSELATRGIKDAPPQLLYIGIFPVGSRGIVREFENAIPAFVRHGMIVKDLPFNKGRAGTLKEASQSSRVSEIDMLKFQFAQEIKRAKLRHRLSNDQICEQSGANRVFLSRILNNRLDGISVEYLYKRVESLRSLK